MFSELDRDELQALFATLGSAAEASHGNGEVLSEIEETQLDVHQALRDHVHAESAPQRAAVEAEADARRARAEAGDPEAYIDFF